MTTSFGRKTRALLGASLVMLAIATQGASAEPPANGAQQPAANFTLTDHTGVTHRLYDHEDAPAIVIATQVNGDPLSKEAVA